MQLLKSPGRRAFGVCVAIGGLLAIGCYDSIGPDVAADGDGPAMELGKTSDAAVVAAEVDILARGLAIALEDDEFRKQILEDLRDSPFQKHALHVASYLSGDRGKSIIGVLGNALGDEAGDFASALATSENVTLLLPTAHTRMTWSGGMNLLVAPASSSVSPDGMVDAYRAGGEKTTIPLWGEIDTPLMRVGVTNTYFGTDPESRRASAPNSSRGTVSTADEEFGLGPIQYVIEPGPCDLDPNLPECDESAHFVAGTEGTCNVPPFYGGDNDGDQFVDSCEQALAAAFAPDMYTQLLDHAPTREEHWAVQPVGGRYRIFYALAYHEDAGYYCCALPLGVSGHQGDSEFVVIDAIFRGDGYWEFDKMFTAAHYGAPGDSSEWTYTPAFTLSRPLAPRVYASRDKHASYNSSSDCDAGAYGLDDCDFPYVVSPFSTPSQYNLGRDAAPLIDCTPSRRGYWTDECFWLDPVFRGWESDTGSSSSAYGGHLRAFGFQ